MKSLAILLTTALTVIASTSALPAQASDSTATAQSTVVVTVTQSSSSTEPTSSNSIPGQGVIGQMGENISDKCLNTIKGIVAIGNAQSCMPAQQLLPIWNQTVYDPVNIANYVSQGLDLLCQAPECPSESLTMASKQLESNCNSKDQRQSLVQGATALIKDYGAWRKLACEKLPNNSTETTSDGNAGTNDKYCLADATQFYINKSLIILTGKWKENPEQLCPPCADTWYSDIKQLEPQYADLKDWKLATYLEDACPYLKNSTQTPTPPTDSQSGSPADTTVVETATTSDQPEATATQSTTPTEKPSQAESTTMVYVTTVE
ncbi:hypothetical protein K7432_018110 [Basidiobolus ranarum]|uniref:Uncharacterized protein n=1 Tax=Basidiobolus ranarum TaxID=34480 RepID=A0ABR2WCK0_9FUNG